MKITAFLVTAMLSLSASHAVAGAATDLDEFVDRMNSIFVAGEDYEGLGDLVDPLGRMGAGISTLISVFNNHTKGGSLQFVEMFRNQTSPNGVKLIGALIDTEGKTAMFLALVLLKHDGIWRAVQINGQSNFEKLPAAFH